MKFGVREICDVVLRAKSAQKIGNKIFYKNEPVIYFDTLKTSSMEGAATTVYAQGGRGNARLVAWEGERTVTFTMEDALISPEGFMILSGAGLIEATDGKPIYQHVTETVDKGEVSVNEKEMTIKISQKPYFGTKPEDGEFEAAKEEMAYVMLMKDGEIVSEPYVPVHENVTIGADGSYSIRVATHPTYAELTKAEKEEFHKTGITPASHTDYIIKSDFPEFDSVLVDYYVERKGNAKQIEITADKFGGNYYLEASTLFRDQNGVDMPAEFIITNCKIQSNFTFTMASSGDPSTFTFTMDAFPDYTRFDHSKKVMAAIQIIEDAGSQDIHRHSTEHEDAHNLLTF